MEIKVDGRVRYTKMRIRESFLKLLKEKPIEKITVTSLCRDAEINRATFYRHYDDCYGVLQEIEDDMIRDLKKTMVGKSREEMFERVLGEIKKNGETYRLVCSENGDRYFTERILRLCAKIRERDMHSLLTSYTPSERGYVYVYLDKGCGAVLGRWIKSGMHEKPGEVASLLETLVKGTEKGL